jgi:DNA helicase-2/ATP-dependent DNA helicase PcrA
LLGFVNRGKGDKMNNPQLIDSDFIVEDIETPFKVVAGPGAGKTYWLARHIETVLKTSKRLEPVSLVACITYTNTGAEELLSELQDTSDRIWVSTIHSFLYTNIVKPYIWLLKNEDGTPVVNYQEMDGHGENVPSPGKIQQWKRGTDSNYVEDKDARRCLAHTTWILENNSLLLAVKPDYYRYIGKYSIAAEKLHFYKQLCWQDGIIHHEDVLYFSYQLLVGYPYLLEFLAAKFPYIFLDEFQDTTPIQTEIVKMLSSAGSCVGIIGDPAQTIFTFTGASRIDFLNFNLPNMKLYHMETNRRSTNQIVKTLNIIRVDDDLVQKPFRNIDGKYPQAYINPDILTAVKLFEEEIVTRGGEHCIITWNNDMVYKIKKRDMDSSRMDIWDYLYEELGYRATFLENLLIAREYAVQNSFELAVKQLSRLFRSRNGYLREPFSQKTMEIDSITKRGLCVSIVENLTQEDQYFENDLLTFYNWASNIIYSSCKRKLSKVTSRGTAKEVMEGITVSAVANRIRLPEVKNDTIRTIHKSKGAQFDSVLVVFDNEKELEYLIYPDLNAEEDNSRLYYVALSRAKNFLSIAIPSIGETARARLQEMGFIINECNISICQ